ncbi:TIGR03546 family protein [Calditrichota bacterium]
MFILEFLAKLFKILRSEVSPSQIAWGMVLGMIIGITPIWSLHNLILFILIIILKVNIAMALLSFGIFSGIAYILDPLFHSLGYYLLVDISSLHGLWTTLYNIPVVALSRYNNTVVLGSLIVAILFILPFYIFSKKFVVVYREKIDPKLQKLKIVQVIKGSKFYSIYQKISDWR